MTQLRYGTLDEIKQLIDEFERCTLPTASWNHRVHLTIGMWYLSRLDEAQATNRVISGIRRYNRANGIEQRADQGYHETVTLFWLTLIREFLKRSKPTATMLDRTNELVDRLGGHRALIRQYYSRDLLNSLQARQGWIEPDKRPLEFDFDEMEDTAQKAQRV